MTRIDALVSDQEPGDEDVAVDLSRRLLEASNYEEARASRQRKLCAQLRLSVTQGAAEPLVVYVPELEIGETPAQVRLFAAALLEGTAA